MEHMYIQKETKKRKDWYEYNSRRL